ncbi:hypothetical protein HAX54_013332, partial [Datura stramonium]|nr:hypothetical protein [Datura stramonium]
RAMEQGINLGRKGLPEIVSHQDVGMSLLLPCRIESMSQRASLCDGGVPQMANLHDK